MKRKQLNKDLFIGKAKDIIIDNLVTKHAGVISDRTTNYLLSDSNKVEGLTSIFKDMDNVVRFDDAEAFIFDAAPELDIANIYCNKTGRPIGTRNTSEIELLLKIHPGSEPKYLCNYIDVSSGCSPAWLQTDSITLDRLQEADPRGYFMYAIGLVCKRITSATGPTRGNFRKQFISFSYIHDFNNSLALGFQALQNVPVDRVIEACELLRKLLGIYNPKRVKWPFIWPEEYASPDGIQFLFDHAEAKINEVAIKEHDFETYLENQKLAAAVKKSGGGTGLSNIMGQRRDKGDILEDAIAKIFIETKVHFMSSTNQKELKAAGERVTNKSAIKAAIEKRKAASSGMNKLHTVPKGFKFALKIKKDA